MTSCNLHKPERGFISRKPAERWEEALVSGNGVMGAMVYGEPLDETIILNRAGLFMPLERPLPPVDTGSHLAEIRVMLDRREYQKAADYVVEQSHREGWGEKQWTDPFIPAFDLRIRMEEHGKVRDYERAVDFSTGVASVIWRDTLGPYVRKLFVSRPDNLVVLSLIGHRPCALNVDLSLETRPTSGQGGWRPEWFFREGIESVSITAEDEWLTYRSGFRRGWPGSLQGYEGAVRIIAPRGSVTAREDTVEIRRADEVLMLIRIGLSHDFKHSGLEALKAEIAAIPPDFDALLARHAAVHGEIFQRARIELGDTPEKDLSSEELIASSDMGHLSPALVGKLFDAGRYVILSATGELPPTLPGIWTGTWGTPWSGDYTQNGNLQTAIAANLSTNMAECLEPYFRYLESQMADYRENARRLYGCRGIHVPSRTSSHGLNNHFDGTWPMTFWTAGAGWAAHFFYDYYLYTGDRDFLEYRALPFMQEAAAFYEDFLFTGSDGRFVFSPSYSPENHPENGDSQACVNATMDIAVARELFSHLIEAGSTLGHDEAQIARWRSMLAKMPEYQVNADGALKEWATPDLLDNNQHRHASHLYALFYGIPPNIEADPTLHAAMWCAVEHRMAFRRQEMTGEMAFGLVQLGQAAASLRDAATCFEIVDWLANWYWSSALTSTHNRGEIFNVDICGGLPDLLSRMLIDSRVGAIDLLPALPGQWPSGRIAGIRCRGQILLHSLAWNRGRLNAVLESQTAQQVMVSVPGETFRIMLEAGKPVTIERDFDL